MQEGQLGRRSLTRKQGQRQSHIVEKACWTSVVSRQMVTLAETWAEGRQSWGEAISGPGAGEDSSSTLPTGSSPCGKLVDRLALGQFTHIRSRT